MRKNAQPVGIGLGYKWFATIKHNVPQAQY